MLEPVKMPAPIPNTVAQDQGKGLAGREKTAGVKSALNLAPANGDKTLVAEKKTLYPPCFRGASGES